MFKACDKVLDMEINILDRYKRSIVKLTGTGIMELYDGLKEEEHIRDYFKYEYKYTVLRHTVRLYTNRYSDSIPYFRKVLEYEVMNDLNDHLYLLKFVEVPFTLKGIKLLTRRQILLLLEISTKFIEGNTDVNRNDTTNAARVALMTCPGCNMTENTLRQFKGCSSCRKVFYCSKACQKHDWEDHKKMCNLIQLLKGNSNSKYE